MILLDACNLDYEQSKDLSLALLKILVVVIDLDTNIGHVFIGHCSERMLSKQSDFLLKHFTYVKLVYGMVSEFLSWGSFFK